MKYWIIGLKNKYLFDEPCSDIDTVKRFIVQNEGIPVQQQRLLIGGSDIQISNHTNNFKADDTITIRVCLSLNGGAKKKGKGKGKGKKKDKKKKKEEPVPPDEFDFMAQDELIKIKKVLSEKLLGVEEERSYFELERDFLQKMYDIIHEYEYGENVVNYKNMESDLECLKNNHRNNIRMYVQKVKHLEYDHNNTINSISMEADMQKNEEKTTHQSKKDKLLRNKKILENELLKKKILNENEIKQMQKHFEDKESTINHEFEQKLNDLHAKYEMILRNLKGDLNLQTKLQIHEIEERKNLHINDLIFNHHKSFNKMKEYYNSITRDNLDLIRSLKSELNESEQKIKSHQTKYQNILNENKKLNLPLNRAKNEVLVYNKKLNLPLNRAKNEVLVYNKKLVNYNKDKRSLKSNQKHLMSLSNKLNRLRNENDTLKHQYKAIINDKADLIGKYSNINAETGNEANDNERKEKLEQMQNQFTLKQNQLNKILNGAKLDKVVIRHLTNKLNTIVDHKNTQIDEQRYQINKTQKMHDDLLRVYQSKIKEISPDVPEHELLHIQYINNVKGATIPAGFVAN
eukprot:169081_1